MTARSLCRADRKVYARSRLTNGKDLLPNIDGRSLIARRYRDIYSGIAADQGGHDHLSVTAERTQWATRISAAWQKSVDSIIETGRLLLAAKADPKMQEFDRRAGARTFPRARRRRRRSSPPRRSSHRLIDPRKL